MMYLVMGLPVRMPLNECGIWFVPRIRIMASIQT